MNRALIDLFSKLLNKGSLQNPEDWCTSKGFYMGVHPVTQAEWTAVMGTDPSGFKGADLPVENVSREDAQAFCKKVREITGQLVRLPTEAEWEYAFRGGTTAPY